MTQDCPCGLPSPYTDCCARFVRSTAFPETAEELMRSRYSAYVMKNKEYLLKTLCAEDRKKEALKNINLNIHWTGLEIVETSKGGRDDTTGEVTFIASFLDDDRKRTHYERSRFQRENGRWVYNESLSQVSLPETADAPAKPFVRDQPKVGRNDPCSCGSGKKYKKCCGK